MHGQNIKEEVLYMKLDEVKSKLTGELKDAIKGKDLAAKAVISVVSAKVTAAAKEAELKGKEFLNDDIIGVFSQELKQVRESLVEAEKAARADVVETCNKQIKFLEKFLPKQLSKEEIKTKVLEIIANLGLKVDELTKKDMGKIMGVANKELKGQADGKEISSTVQELIEK
jgi:uncharacterized protein YqeY